MSRDILFKQAPPSNTLTVREAGRLGGLALLEKRGRPYFAQIGQMGQRAMRRKYPNRACEWGKLGGRPRKLNLSDMGQEGKLKKGGEADPPFFSTAYPAPS